MLNAVYIRKNWRRGSIVLQASHMLRRVEECDPDKTEWTEYKQNLDLYKKANGLAGNFNGV